MRLKLQKPRNSKLRVARPPFDPQTEGFCTHCRIVKPRDYFSANKNGPNGIHWWCKRCITLQASDYEADPSYYRRRRDAQALGRRVRENRRVGRPIATGPVRPRFSARGVPIVRDREREQRELEASYD